MEQTVNRIAPFVDAELTKRERIERKCRRRGADIRLREMRAIAKRCSRLMGPGTPSIDHGDMLYDERGLPK